MIWWFNLKILENNLDFWKPRLQGISFRTTLEEQPLQSTQVFKVSLHLSLFEGWSQLHLVMDLSHPQTSQTSRRVGTISRGIPIARLALPKTPTRPMTDLKRRRCERQHSHNRRFPHTNWDTIYRRTKNTQKHRKLLNGMLNKMILGMETYHHNELDPWSAKSIQLRC